MRAAPKQAGEKGEDGQRVFPSFSSHGISASPGKTSFSGKIYQISVKQAFRASGNKIGNQFYGKKETFAKTTFFYV